MATTNLAMTLPTVGGSTNAWGGTLNDNLDIIDAVFATAGTGTSVGLNIGSGKTLAVAGALNVTGTVTLPATANITNSQTYTISTVVGSASSGVATVTFSPAASIIVGTLITISGTTNFNGNHTVTSSSAGSASFATGTTATDVGGSLYFPLTIVTASGVQTLTNKTLQDVALAGNVTGTYSLLGTPTLGSALTSLGNITFTKATPIITLDNSGSTFGYRFQAAVDTTDGGFFLQQRSGVSWNTALTVASDRGLLIGGASGGSQGVGTVNATGYYVNGSLQPINRGYASTGTINMTVNQTITLSHGMAVLPEIVTFTLTCTDAGGDAGYAQNDQIMIPLNNGQTFSSNNYGYSTQISSTQIIIRVVNGAGPLVIVNKSTKALAGLNENKWSLLVRAYA
jgi:hypothetical protein